MKISISGTQCSGKTHLLNSLHSNYNYLPYHETVRDISNFFQHFNKYNSKINITLNSQTSDFSQSVFLNHYYNMMQLSYNSSEVHVFDRFALDVMIYWRNHFFDHNNCFKVCDINSGIWNLELINNVTVHKCITKALDFLDYIVFLEYGAYPMVDDGVRDINLQTINNIQQRFKNLHQLLLSGELYEIIKYKPTKKINLIYCSSEFIKDLEVPLYQWLNNIIKGK